MVKSTLGLGEWYLNLPFELIPEEFIARITQNYYPTTSVEEWKSMVGWLNKAPNVWNNCLIENKAKPIAFLYGDWDPLLSHIQVIRISIDPKLFRVSGELYKDIANAGREHAKLLGVKRIYFITCRWEAFLRKASELFSLAEARVLEVRDV